MKVGDRVKCTEQQDHDTNIIVEGNYYYIVGISGFDTLGILTGRGEWWMVQEIFFNTFTITDSIVPKVTCLDDYDSSMDHYKSNNFIAGEIYTTVSIDHRSVCLTNKQQNKYQWVNYESYYTQFIPSTRTLKSYS